LALASAVAVPPTGPLKVIRVPIPLEVGEIDPAILKLPVTTVAEKFTAPTGAPLMVTVEFGGEKV
jgi:hypothetical protein